MKRQILVILVLLFAPMVWANYQPQFSTAGFYELKESGRSVASMNPAWRFLKGTAINAEAVDFDDKEWTAVSLPHGIEYLPTEASGNTNYQGEVWYRKHFTPDFALKGKKLFLYFEAVMGKAKIFVNGKLLSEHFGGYLPIIVDITNTVQWGQENLIAVWADNSDDPMYPPGKPQDVLDFAYLGGIYRDVWLVAHNDTYITDPNFENEIAGGGLFVAYDNVFEGSADVSLKLHIRNEKSSVFTGVVEYELQQPNGKKVAFSEKKIDIAKKSAIYSEDKLEVTKPMLWSPDSPTLYNLIVRIRDEKGTIIDGYRRRIGIRSYEFKGIDGFWLNGKPYPKPIIGANRHQDFAVVGNALSNSTHWRDAKKLKDLGLEVIRNAHYPQDPAFMDACDELGLFVIVNTPGWQFWNEAPIFEQRVYQDIRNMVRRDRNRPSVWLWEPILNETWYPADFAKNTRDIVYEEYPYPYCYTGCDSEAKGHEYFPVLFTHPLNGDGGAFSTDVMKDSITYFTREWGDNVDDWSSHNSPSRVARNWGETPMLIQAKHYASPTYKYTSYDALYKTPRHHIGGALWHSFDHQRGYHPDPFYGGLMDVFRQPKYSYYMFKAQRSPEVRNTIAETGPMVYIAHEMTPFSSKDVTVYSNCEEVRLTFNKGGKTHSYQKQKDRKGLPSPIILFPDVYDFMVDKALSRQGKQEEVYLLAEGLIGGKVVATHKVRPARRAEKILLWLDNEGVQLEANGSDFVTVVAGVADKNSSIKRLNNYYINFQISGEGRILGDASILANPAPVRWGTAPILVQSTLKAGKIKVTANVLFEGSQMPVSAVIEFESKPSRIPLIYSEKEASQIDIAKEVVEKENTQNIALKMKLEQVQKELNTLKLKEVERQQTEFGEKEKK